MSQHERPLFEVYPALRDRLPWTPLATLPTPVQRLSNLGSTEGIPNLYIKRDDLTSPLYGGNKLRKLEFLLAEARRRHARTVITAGGAGSNHALATTIYAAKLGLRTALMLVDQPVARCVGTNLLLDRHYGARLCKTSLLAFPLRLVYVGLTATDWRRLRPPYYIPFGGSSPLGCLGYVNAALELRKQVDDGILPQPDYIHVAAGTTGTATGLTLGLRLARLQTQVVAVRVTDKRLCSRTKMSRLASRTSALLTSLDPSIPAVTVSPGEVTMLDDFIGQRYGQFTPEGMEAVRLMAEQENIRLEGTYTGKALAGALDFIKSNGLQDRHHLFWNTYNSADISHLVRDMDYRDLPRAFHRYFRSPCQDLDTAWQEPAESQMSQPTNP